MTNVNETDESWQLQLLELLKEISEKLNNIKSDTGRLRSIETDMSITADNTGWLVNN